ncbi:MAG: hypothetical protein FJZ01_05755 [Candidatus Sericytochromatia bacterium]|nr:hypothetical protein [Candidatus Tanganyikabacteria bacterium]
MANRSRWLAALAGMLVAALAGVLVVALAGCALAVLPERFGGRAQPPTVGPQAASIAASIAAGAPAALPPGSVAGGKGRVELSVRWPERAAQLIPDSAGRVVFDFKQGGTLVASASLTRPGGATTATAAVDVDGGAYRLEAAAQSGPAFTPVATAATDVVVVPGARVAVALTLGPAYPPAVAGLSQTAGLVGEAVVLAGSNLVLSWAATPSVRFTGTTASVSATVTAVGTDTVTVRVPAGAVSGAVRIAVDGVPAATVSFAIRPGSPFLAFILTPVASAGDTIFLEGIFGSSAVVNFPGGVTFNASVLGPHRASVAVPAGATAGPLTVTTAGTTIAGRPFRAPFFSLGLGAPFQARYDQIAGASRMPGLVTPRRGAGICVIGNYLYVIGGTTGSSLDSVERAAIQADGTLGPFSTVPGVTLAVAEGGPARVIGNFVYLFGYTTIQRATIGENGNLSTFQTVAGVATTAQSAPGIEVIGRYVYAVGGYNSQSGYMKTVERAPIDDSGNLGPFEPVAGTTLVTQRYAFATAVVGDKFYVIGGSNGPILTSVERASIDGSGNLGTFEAVPGVTLAAQRFAFGSAVIGPHVYLIGGSDGPFLGSVERATISAGGTLSTFQAVAGTALATPRDNFGTAVVGNYLYVVGGYNGSNVGGVERVAINGSGGLATFGAAPGGGLQTPRGGFTSAIAGGYVYVLGGYGGTYLATVERAPVDAAGDLGAFSAVTGGDLPTSRSGHTSAVIGNYLYVLGGYGPSISFGTQIERATLDPAGNLGAFETLSGVTLESGRAVGRCVVIGNYLYHLGGYRWGWLKTVERAQIDGAGNLATFQAVGDVNLVREREKFGIAVLGNWLYVIGGYDGQNLLDSVERAPIDGSGNLGAFATIAGITLTTARNAMSCVVIGRYLYVVGGEAAGKLDTVERAPISTSGELGPFEAVTGVTLGLARAEYGIAAVGNYLYAVAGFGNSGATSTVERALLR